MAAPAAHFQPFSRLVRITVLGHTVGVPENNTLLRCFQYLASEQVSYGRFCWNEQCQYCRVQFDLGQGTSLHTALACKIIVQDGMRVRSVTPEIKYCLRSLNREEENKSYTLSGACSSDVTNPIGAMGKRKNGYRRTSSIFYLGGDCP